MPPSNSRRINGSVSTVSSFASRDQYSRQASAEVQISPDFSEPSIQSRSTNGSGPSMKQPALITSSWVSNPQVSLYNKHQIMYCIFHRDFIAPLLHLRAIPKT